MNFKFYIFLSIFLAASCGLKTKPKALAGTNLPSLMDQYSKETFKDSDKKLNKKK